MFGHFNVCPQGKVFLVLCFPKECLHVSSGCGVHRHLLQFDHNRYSTHKQNVYLGDVEERNTHSMHVFIEALTKHGTIVLDAYASTGDYNHCLPL